MPSRLTRAFSSALLVLVFAAALSSRADADLWGHVRFGIDTLHSRRLTAVDPYSFTQDTPWINHEWLSEVQMGAAYLAAGPAGLQVLKAVVIAIVSVLIWTALADVRVSVRLITFVVLFIGTIHMWATIRPQLWSLLSMALMCRILISRSTRVRWWLPVIFACWANCHGGWVAGLGVLVVWTAAATVIRSRDWGVWIGVCAASAVSTLCNPYGWGLWEFLLRTVRVTRSIEEWQPLWQAPDLNWMPWVVAVGTVSWLMVRSTADRALPTAGALAVLAYGAMRVQRVESLFVVAAAILAAPFMAGRWPAGRRRPGVPADVQRSATWAATAGALVFAGWIGSRSLGCIPIFGDWVPDRATAGVLVAAAPGRLVTAFDWGEYAIWHFGPKLKVSIDGRRETVYSDEALARNDAVLAGTPLGLSVLVAWRAEYLWLPSTSVATRDWLLANGYRVDAESANSFVAVRSDLPVLVAPQAHHDPADCFPQ